MCLRGRSVTPDVRSDPDTNGTASGRGNSGCDCGGRRLSARDQRRGRNGSLFRRPMERTVQVGGDALPGEPSLRIARGGRCWRHKGPVAAGQSDRSRLDGFSGAVPSRPKPASLPTIPHFAWTEDWLPAACGSGKTEGSWYPWPGTRRGSGTSVWSLHATPNAEARIRGSMRQCSF